MNYTLIKNKKKRKNFKLNIDTPPKKKPDYAMAQNCPIALTNNPKGP